MNKVARALLLVGVVVLALLIGLLIGRGQRIQPTAEAGANAAVQITTAPVANAAPPPPLPAPVVQAPQPVAIPKVAPDVQVEEDAAAVGMTTREPTAQGNSGGAGARPAPKNAADDNATPQPIG
jgi:hypothetical protein